MHLDGAAILLPLKIDSSRSLIEDQSSAVNRTPIFRGDRLDPQCQGGLWRQLGDADHWRKPIAIVGRELRHQIAHGRLRGMNRRGMVDGSRGRIRRNRDGVSLARSSRVTLARGETQENHRDQGGYSNSSRHEEPSNRVSSGIQAFGLRGPNNCEDRSSWSQCPNRSMRYHENEIQGGEVAFAAFNAPRCFRCSATDGSLRIFPGTRQR
jgi:hypothetical protein